MTTERKDILITTEMADHDHTQQAQEREPLPAIAKPAPPSDRSRTRFTHDIKDQNNSILLGTDLLLKCWEDLRAHLDELHDEGTLEISESLHDICTTIPAVIDGIRKSTYRIEHIIDNHQ